MPRPAYKERLTNEELIELFNQGKYYADLQTGLIYSEKTECEVFTYNGSRTGNYRWIRIYDQPKHRTIAVAHIIWMVGSQCSIPKGWQIHHKDTNESNNCFSNLICLHPIDHQKVHSEGILTEKNPF